MLLDLNQNNPFATQSELEVDKNQLNEVEFIFQRIRVVYATLDDWNSSDADRVFILFLSLILIEELNMLNICLFVNLGRIFRCSSARNAKAITCSFNSKNSKNSKNSSHPYSDLRRSSTVIPSKDTTPRRISSKFPKQHLHRYIH